jgi:hypothetical protein
MPQGADRKQQEKREQHEYRGGMEEKEGGE